MVYPKYLCRGAIFSRTDFFFPSTAACWSGRWLSSAPAPLACCCTRPWSSLPKILSKNSSTLCNPLLSARGRCHCDQLCVSCFLSTLSKENATAVSVTTCVEFYDGAYGGNIPLKTLCSVFKIVKDKTTLHWNIIGWRKEKTTFTPGLKLFSMSRWIAANTLFVVDYLNPSKAELPQLGSWWYHSMA